MRKFQDMKKSEKLEAVKGKTFILEASWGGWNDLKTSTFLAKIGYNDRKNKFQPSAIREISQEEKQLLIKTLPVLETCNLNATNSESKKVNDFINNNLI